MSFGDSCRVEEIRITCTVSSDEMRSEKNDVTFDLLKNLVDMLSFSGNLKWCLQPPDDVLTSRDGYQPIHTWTTAMMGCSGKGLGEGNGGR